MKTTQLLVVAISALTISAGAFGSGTASRATGPGPTGLEAGEGGAPAIGDNCLFSYSIQKIGPTIAERGEEIKYHVIVANIGTCRLRHIRVTDLLPEDAEFIKAEPEPTFHHDRRLVWEDVELRAGRYADFEIKARVNHERRHDESFTNVGCAFTPWIGTRICGVATTQIERDDDLIVSAGSAVRN